MKRFCWLITVLLCACSKQSDEKKVIANLQPSSIAVISIDPVSRRETPVYQFIYYFNGAAERFDSIVTIRDAAQRQRYVFDYSQIAAHRILLNVTGSSTYSEYVLDENNFTLAEYRDHAPAGVTTYALRYDGLTRIQEYDYTGIPNATSYTRTFADLHDTTIMHTTRTAGACNTSDTLISSPYDMGNRLSYLFFVELFSAASCGVPPYSPAYALPFTSYVYKLPLKIVNGDMQTDYAYESDDQGRLVEVTVTRKRISLNYIESKLKMLVAY
jgi:YD repeat-containing protein